MRYAAVIGFALIQACAPPVWTPPARTDAATCIAPGAPASSPWQLVTAQRFTFCVPVAWRASDGPTWRSGGSFLGWCARDHMEQCPKFTGYFSLTVISNPNQATAAAIAREGGECSSDRFEQSIGGTPTTLIDQHCIGRHITEAAWMGRPLHFFGQTDDAVVAHL